MKESKFQHDLIQHIYERFPGSMVLKNDPNYIQGIPDLIILFKSHWSLLEVKRNKRASHRPNQDWYIEHWGKFTYTAIVFPENEGDVLDAMEESFRTVRNTRTSRSKSK